MKLIDADAFLERTSKDPLFPLLERYGLSGVIENEPKVDAIPIEWMEKWLDDFMGVKQGEEITNLDVFKKDVYHGIFLMYNDWRRENETDKSSR